MKMKRLVSTLLAVLLCTVIPRMACATVYYDTTGRVIRGIDVPFPLGLFRGVLTIAQSPFEIIHVFACVSPDKSDAGGETADGKSGNLASVLIAGTICAPFFVLGRAVLGVGDVLTLGCCGEMFYTTTLMPPWIFQATASVRKITPYDPTIKPNGSGEKEVSPPASETPAPDVPAALPSQPLVQTPSVAGMSYEKFIGKWASSQKMKSVIRVQATGRDVEHESVTSSTHFFYDDGMYRWIQTVNGKETSWRGTWRYSNGILHAVVKKPDGGEMDMGLNVTCLSDTEVLLKYVDLEQFAEMFAVSPDVKSSKASYDESGRLHHEMVVSGNFMTSVYEPLRLVRVGDVEE